MIVQPALLRRGSGNGKPEDGLCLMQMVDWFAGCETVSDHPACACPVLSQIGIWLNDLAPTQKDRDSLWPLVWQLLGSKDDGAKQLRAEHIVRKVTQRIVAPLFDDHWPEHAAALRLAVTMSQIAAAAAAAGAEAEAWAATWAATAAARGAATAAAAAGAAAEARARAAAGAWEVMREIFIEAIALGKHDEEDPVYTLRAEQLARMLENAH